MGNRENKMRITIDVPESLNERLEEIQELTGASTKAAVVREALKLFDYLVDQEGSGYRVYLGLSDQFFPLPLLTDIGRARAKGARPVSSVVDAGPPSSTTESDVESDDTELPQGSTVAMA